VIRHASLADVVFVIALQGEMAVWSSQLQPGKGKRKGKGKLILALN
jgi:hypothetical protein